MLPVLERILKEIRVIMLIPNSATLLSFFVVVDKMNTPGRLYFRRPNVNKHDSPYTFVD